MRVVCQSNSRLMVLLTLLAVTPLVTGQGRFRTITFDGYPTIPPGDDIGVDYYYEDGMTFRPMVSGGSFGRAGGGRTGFPDNGTAYLIFGLGDSLSGTMSLGDYQFHFGLHAVDLAEFSTHYPFPTTVQFIGYRADGSSVTTQFTTDGIIDGPSGFADFQTFYFDDRFSDIVRFEAPNARYAMDNLVFWSVVPEPSAATLALVGVATAAALRRRNS